jgi:hypothetical protein
MKKIIRFVGGPPGTGKSTFSSQIVRRVQEQVKDRPVILMDGDMFFPPAARVMMSQNSGIELDTRDFAMKFNLPAQLLFQQLIRTAADGGRLVIATAPFENMFSIVEGMPLWEKMRTQDFAGYDIDLTYVLLSGRQQLVEDEIRNRLVQRGERCPYQAKLDEKKIANPNYYQERAALVRKSVETFGFKLFEDNLLDDWEQHEVADKLADLIIATL